MPGGGGANNNSLMSADSPLRLGEPAKRYRIRPARPEDAPALALVEAMAFDPGHYGGMMMTRRSFRDHAKCANALLVAEDLTKGRELAGYALGMVKQGSHYVRFASLAVTPKHGGKGAGRMLFEALETFARKQGYRGVRLEVRADNQRLLERYQGLGYTVFAIVEDYYPDGCAAIRLVRDL